MENIFKKSHESFHQSKQLLCQLAPVNQMTTCDLATSMPRKPVKHFSRLMHNILSLCTGERLDLALIDHSTPCIASKRGGNKTWRTSKNCIILYLYELVNS